MPNTRTEGETFARLGEVTTRCEALSAELMTYARDLNEDDVERFDALEAEYNTLSTERAQLSRRAEIITRTRSAISRGRGVEGPGGINRASAQLGETAGLAMRALDLSHQRSEVSDRGAERLETLLRGDEAIAEYVAITGDPAYRAAFEALLRHGPADARLVMTDEQAAAMRSAMVLHRSFNEGTNAQGGYLVPFYLDPSIHLTNAGSTNPFRQASRTETISTNEWHGITSAGVTAGYLAEGVEVGDDTPSDLAQPTVRAEKCAAYLEATFEALQDTNIGSQVAMLIQDAKDNFEAAEMTVGSGATGNMQGVITGVAAVPGSVVATASAGTFTVDDVYAPHDAVPDRYTQGASWAAHRKIITKVRQFATGTGQSTGAFWAQLGEGNPPLLIGDPIRAASAMDSTVATGKNIMVVGNFRQGYLIVDRIGMSIQYNPLVVGPNGRPTGKVGWFAHWRTGAKVIDAGALRLLQVA